MRADRHTTFTCLALLAGHILLAPAATAAGPAETEVRQVPQPRPITRDEYLTRRTGASRLGLPPPVAPAPPQPRMERLSGVWIEGPGYDVTYGADYDTCASRCLAAARCMMVEYYRPERKCNLYDRSRPRLTGGASFVGLKR